MKGPLLLVKEMVKSYHRPGLMGALGARRRPAVDGVTLRVDPGEVVGLIGESGSGKTTLVKAAMGHLPIDSGQRWLMGLPLDILRRKEHRRLRLQAQLLLQSPDASLNPNLPVADHLLESARLHRPGENPMDLAREAADKVGILHRFRAWPHQLSGGEKRRVGIARLLIAQPLLMVADEPTAGLDASLKADIVDLLLQAHDEHVGHLIISHDLDLVGYSCDRMVVINSGIVLEETRVRDLASTAHHPYTSSLLQAAGILDAPLGRTSARPATVARVHSGCPFAPFCPIAIPLCHRERPLLGPPPSPSTSSSHHSTGSGKAHRIACHVMAGV